MNKSSLPITGSFVHKHPYFSDHGHVEIEPVQIEAQFDLPSLISEIAPGYSERLSMPSGTRMPRLQREIITLDQAKHIERIGDYVKDICELNFYLREAVFTNTV